jgi:hypothetical protein
MNNDNTVAYSKAANPNRKEMKAVKNILPREFNFYGNGTMWGVQAGAMMGLFLIALQYFGGENAIALKFFKYLFLIGILGIGLNTYKDYLYKDTIFKNGMLLGAFIAFVSALTLVAISTLLFLFAPDLAFEKFGLTATNFKDFLAVSGTVFFEVLTLGMIATFIILQYFKSTFKPNEGLQE